MSNPRENIIRSARRRLQRFASQVAEVFSGIMQSFEFATRRAAPARIEFRQNEKGWSLSFSNRQRLLGQPPGQALKNAPWNDALDAAASLPPLTRAISAVDIVFPDSKCFTLKKALPAEGRSKALQILRFELERATPFKWSEVFADYYLEAAADADRPRSYDANLVIIKSSVLSPLLDDILRADLRPAAVFVEDETKARLPVNLLRHSQYRMETLPGRINRSIAITAAIAVAVLLMNVSAGLWRQYAQMEATTKLVGDAQAKAVAVSKAMSDRDVRQAKLTGPRARKIEDVSVLKNWEDLTRTVPGSAWLTSIRMDGPTVQIEGYAQAASELISLLSAVPEFSKVEFVTPVIRDTQVAAERFQIRLKVERKSATAVQSTQGEISARRQ